MNSEVEKFDLVTFGVHVIFSYVLSLRGSEGLMTNLSTTNPELEKLKNFCLIDSKGKVKGESSKRDHLFPCVKVIKSRINVFTWLKMLKSVQAVAGRLGGPVITS